MYVILSFLIAFYSNIIAKPLAQSHFTDADHEA